MDFYLTIILTGLGASDVAADELVGRLGAHVRVEVQPRVVALVVGLERRGEREDRQYGCGKHDGCNAG